MAVERAYLDKHGRVVIPASFRKEMGWHPGEKLTLSLGDNELRMLSVRQAIKKLQDEVRKYVPEGVSLADELIRERREEVRREEEREREEEELLAKSRQDSQGTRAKEQVRVA
jgi:AbrB family looped-hinge helix DNA binding protein